MNIRWKLLISILLLFSITACSAEESTAPNSIPSLNEISEYRLSHTEEETSKYMETVISLIAKTPYEDMYTDIATSLDIWTNEQKYLQLNDYSISFCQSLKMNTLHNQKWFRNIDVDIGLWYDPTLSTETDTGLFDLILEDIVKALQKTTIGKYKLAKVHLSFYIKGSESSYNELTFCDIPDGGNFDPLYDRVDWQMPGEKNAQTIAFNFAKEIDQTVFASTPYRHSFLPETFLNQFGVTADNTLYIEIHSNNNAPDAEVYLSSLGYRADNLYNALLKDKASNIYVQQCNQVQIMFSIGNKKYPFIFD